MSVADPVLQPGDVFGIRAGIGQYGSETGIGISALGIASRNLFGGGETPAFSLGAGVGVNHGNIGGRAGIQLTWK